MTTNNRPKELVFGRNVREELINDCAKHRQEVRRGEPTPGIHHNPTAGQVVVTILFVPVSIQHKGVDTDFTDMNLPGKIWQHGRDGHNLN